MGRPKIERACVPYRVALPWTCVEPRAAVPRTATIVSRHPLAQVLSGAQTSEEVRPIMSVINCIWVSLLAGDGLSRTVTRGTVWRQVHHPMVAPGERVR